LRQEGTRRKLERSNLQIAHYFELTETKEGYREELEEKIIIIHHRQNLELVHHQSLAGV